MVVLGNKAISSAILENVQTDHHNYLTFLAFNAVQCALMNRHVQQDLVLVELPLEKPCQIKLKNTCNLRKEREIRVKKITPVLSLKLMKKIISCPSMRLLWVARGKKLPRG